MNILQQEDIIKGLPDQALQEEAKSPSGQVPQYLVVSEIQRRTDMRNKYKDPNEEQPQGTIADQITQEGIASVQPQQPPQEEPQQMQAYGGGMTPFMRKYASGGAVRMQAGGVTPVDINMQYRNIAEKYPFMNGRRDEILQGLSTVDPDDFNIISSMYNNNPEINAVLASRGFNASPTQGGISLDEMAQINAEINTQTMPDDNAVRPELFEAKMPQPPMPIENVTTPRLLNLNGVNTLTPDGQRPYPPDTPSLDTLDQFSNAFKEDAKRANLLLATLNDATPEQEEAISNPVDIDLPRTLDEIGKDAPKSLTNKKPAFYQQKPDDSSILKRLFEDVGNSTSASMDRGATYLSPSIGTVSNAVGDAGSLVGEGASAVDSFMKKGILDVGEYVTGDLADSLTAGDFSSPYEAGRTISASATQPISFLADKLGDGYQGAYNLTAGMLEPIENLGRGLVGADERQGKGFRYDTPRGLFQQDDSGKSFYFGGSDSGGSNSSSAEDLINFAEQQGSPSRQQLIDANSIGPAVEKTVVTPIEDNTNANVGPKTEEQQLKAAEKGASLLDKLLGLGLEGDKKQAYAMALMALGKGISDGDTAGGLQNAGLAANAIMEQSADRRDKAADREITSSYYKEKLQDTRDSKKADMNYKIQTLYNKYLETAIGATDQQKADELQRITLSITGNLGDTVATGDDINNQRNAANVNFNTLKT